MKGLPKQLNSKQDYIYAKENLNESYWKPLFQDLLDSRFNWFYEKDLDFKEQGIEDETHKIVENKEEEDKITYSQYIWKENKDAKIYRIGFTVEEVQEIINE